MAGVHRRQKLLLHLPEHLQGRLAHVLGGSLHVVVEVPLKDGHEAVQVLQGHPLGVLQRQGQIAVIAPGDLQTAVGLNLHAQVKKRVLCHPQRLPQCIGIPLHDLHTPEQPQHLGRSVFPLSPQQLQQPRGIPPEGAVFRGPAILRLGTEDSRQIQALHIAHQIAVTHGGVPGLVAGRFFRAALDEPEITEGVQLIRPVGQAHGTRLPVGRPVIAGAVTLQQMLGLMVEGVAVGVLVVRSVLSHVDHGRIDIKHVGLHYHRRQAQSAGPHDLQVSQQAVEPVLFCL